MRIVKNIKQGTQEWFELRTGVITASNSSRAFSSRKDTRLKYIYELIGEKIAPVKRDGFVSPAMERGLILEETLKASKYTQYSDVGFVFGDKEWYGYSPDGVLFDEKQEDFEEDIEIKSPEATNFVKYLIEDKIPDEYFEQMIFPFVVKKNLKRRKLIIYNPDVFDKSIMLKEIIVERNDYFSEIEKMQLDLEKFRQERIENFKKLQK